MVVLLCLCLHKSLYLDIFLIDGFEVSPVNLINICSNRPSSISFLICEYALWDPWRQIWLFALVLQVLLGLLSVWNVSFFGYPARVSNYPDYNQTTTYYASYAFCLLVISWYFQCLSRQSYPIPKLWRNLPHTFNRQAYRTYPFLFQFYFWV